MAGTESSRKAHYIGVWREDTFSDEVLKNIAAYTQAERGKRVKLIMNKEGLRMIRSRILKEDTVEFYPLQQIKTVAKNARSDRCVMFIMTDNTKKYKIIVLRCASEADAIYIANFFSQFKRNNAAHAVELQKRGDTGHWTLRERSAHNASLHLREVFKENDEQQEKPNGDINGNEIISDQTPTKVQNGILKRQNSSSFPYTDIQPGITSTEWETGGVTAYSSGYKSDDDHKALAEHHQIADKVAPYDNRRISMGNRGAILMPDKPKFTDGRIYTPAPVNTSNFRRISGDLALFRQHQPIRAVPGRNSMIVKVDNTLMMGTLGKQRPSSMRITPRTFSTSSTIQRSIEATYAKPVIIQPSVKSRRASGNSMILMQPNQRPQSIHVMGGNHLQIHQNLSDMKL